MRGAWMGVGWWVGGVLILMGVGRLLFTLYNAGEAGWHPTALAVVEVLLSGIRFDLSVLAYWFGISGVLAIAGAGVHPLPLVAGILYWTAGMVCFLLILIDIAFYQFQGYHLTAGILSYWEPFVETVNAYWSDYWWVLILLVGVGVGWSWWTGRLVVSVRSTKLCWWQRLAAIMVLVPLLIVCARGGLQYVPLMPVSARQTFNDWRAEALLTAPFTFMHSLGKRHLQPLNILREDEAMRLYPVWRRYSPSSLADTLRHYNFLLVVVESMSAEYVGYYRRTTGYPLGPSLTPFLDSLLERSLVFTQAYACGTRSRDGFACLLASLPALMDESFVASEYQHLPLLGLGHIFRQMGYTTAFFHGARPGSMGLDRLAASAGFQYQFSMRDYPRPREHFDGTWGIWDSYFLPWVAQVLDTLRKPFAAVVFTLSLHHPFSVPPQWSPPAHARSNIEKLIAYTDQSLKAFFTAVAERRLFDHTFIVLTADHAGLPLSAEYNHTLRDRYHILMAIHAPFLKGMTGTNEQLVAQTDLLPTVAHLWGYEKTITAFGRSVFGGDTLPAIAVIYKPPSYWMLTHTDAVEWHEGIPPTHSLLIAYIQNYRWLLTTGRLLPPATHSATTTQQF